MAFLSGAAQKHIFAIMEDMVNDGKTDQFKGRLLCFDSVKFHSYACSSKIRCSVTASRVSVFKPYGGLGDLGGGELSPNWI